jgi:hypothetical protein
MMIDDDLEKSRREKSGKKEGMGGSKNETNGN